MANLAILTLISNVHGTGPGHSAIAMNGMVFSFQEIGDNFPHGGDAWLIVPLKDYVARNGVRPVVVQEINERVDTRKVMAYIQRSIQDGDDYIRSGVCSSQVASAVASGMDQAFNPGGPDTPADVFLIAQRMGIVRRTYYYWADEGTLPEGIVESIRKKMAALSPAIPPAGPSGILNTSPPPQPIPVILPAPAPAARTHPMGQTETLSMVSKLVYAAKSKPELLWPILHDANLAKFGPNPNVLKPGLLLTIPDVNQFSEAQLAEYRRRGLNWRNWGK